MNESTELVTVTQPGVVATMQQPVDDTGLDSVVLKPSSIVLIQNTTRSDGGGRLGQLLDTLSMEVFDEITVVPLSLRQQRVMFPPGEPDLDAEPICRSDDGVVPSQYAQAPQSRLCKTCPHSQWLNGKKSACAEKIRMLVVKKDTGVPYFFTAGGKSISTLKQAIQLIKRYIAMNDADIRAGKTNADGSEIKPLSLYDFFFTIKGEVVNGKFKYAVARFDNIKRVANPGDFGVLFEEYVVRSRARHEEVVAQQNEAQANQAVSEVVEAEFVAEV